MRWVRLTLPAVVVVGGLIFVNSWTPWSRAASITEDALACAAVAAAWIGCRRQAGDRRGAWRLIAIALTGWVVGDLVWDGYTFVGLERPDVSLADLLYLAAYPVLAVGLLRLARANGNASWRDGRLDGFIFAGAATFAVWQFLVVPIAATTTSWMTSTVWSAYPLGDVLMLGGLAWLIFMPTTRDRATVFLVGALSVLLVVDFLYSYLPTTTEFDLAHLDPAYPVAYALFAAAALTSTPARGPQHSEVARVHPARFGLLGFALCAAATVIVVADTDATTRGVYLVLALSLVTMVVSRFALAIRALERVQHELEHKSMHDELTGVLNRVLVLDRIEHALQRRTRRGSDLAVLYIDLDHFKLVNDLYGHDAGDRVLVETTRRISSTLRASDTLGRLGGDEFIILCEETSSTDALRIAERIVLTIGDPVPFADDLPAVTASVGIAVTSSGSNSVEALVRDADTAMYEAKRHGGNKFEVCDARIRESFTRRREIEEALRDATASDELLLEYQPIVDIGTGTVGSFEALLRWRRADGSFLQPAEFIPIAEDAGAIVGIGGWVIEQACARLSAWKLDGIDNPAISVNVSPVQFRNGELVHQIKRALARSGADSSRLIVEITESTLLRDGDEVITQLERLRQLGVQVAIDDFGTGYSALSYLHRLPVDIVKIDRSLTQELADDPAARLVLGSITQLAHALGFRVIAEGAETASDVERLSALGCEQIQGFYFSRPVPASTADQIARRGSISQRASTDHTRATLK
jgi:diguanylate cyclase (GGDEF)-like protein